MSDDRHALSTGQDAARFRWIIYLLLIFLSSGTMLARIMQVRSPSRSDPSPLLSANDRSRWCTIRALVDHGTYAIDNIMFKPDGSRNRAWHTIDAVKHRGADGREHYYSSKPTLYTTLLAAPYWVIKNVSGATLEKRTFDVVRTMLIIVNLLPLVLAMFILARLAEHWGTSHFDRIVVVATFAFGTPLTTFVVTLNNHLPAAITLVFAIAAARPMLEGKSAPLWRYFLAGLFAAATLANELPALSFLVLLGAVLLLQDWKRTLLGYVPAIAIIAAGMFGTNLVAHGSWRTPYAHRSDGPLLATIDSASQTDLDAQRVPAGLLQLASDHAAEPLKARTMILEREPARRWILWDFDTQQRFALVMRDDGSAIELRAWDNWYDYAGSYWTRERLEGVDRGEASRLVYFFHCTFGHHGLFSLAPILLISAIGALLWLGNFNLQQRRLTSGLALSTVLLTVVCLAFYISRPLIDRNYGGVCCCLRWMLWLAPLWMLVMFPALARAEKKFSLVVVVLFLLAASVFSAQYATANPWSHPWIYDYWMQLGWIAH
ncbi:hypothetical protein Psta_4321 [Pirellula staleyi DSM 6068]|uniref:Glycosyltransferase RgtA/B/C/D-like domain-containing protein n=1 Tax=Pirellula staleyi (strain ATCC 27377 / DSM 6068 / ICPB 4128) TaxID=530564 RepID=D2R506_PIRSD|nr:hypothetical protein [Pirellula staleyi]ADB18968.1 hypothetical protein Psta_4321 [Pirellula staleyi DSM 6068]